MTHETQTQRERPAGILRKLRRSMGGKASGESAPAETSELLEAKNLTAATTWKALSVLEAVGSEARTVRVVSPEDPNASETRWNEEFDTQAMGMDEASATLAVGPAGTKRRVATVGLEVAKSEGTISSIVNLRMKPTAEQIQNGGAEASYNEHYRIVLDAGGNLIRQEKIVTLPQSGPQVYELKDGQGITGSIFDFVGNLEEAVNEQLQTSEV